MKTAVVIRHVAFEDLGSLEPALTEAGYTFEYVEAGRDNIDEIYPLKADLLIILGGPISVYEPHHYPFITDEIELLKQRLAADRPVLGICLGAQLIAAAMGTKVYPGPVKEIGWAVLNIHTHPDCMAIAALENVKVLHWHGDTFDLPPGCTLLASSENYQNQAFCRGKNVLGLQFHPEVTEKNLECWYIGHAHELSTSVSLSVNEMRLEGKSYATALTKHAEKMWKDWLQAL